MQEQKEGGGGQGKQNTQGFSHTLKTKFPDVILIFLKYR